VKVGDACYLPCMARLHWLRFEALDVNHHPLDGDVWARCEAMHTCRGIVMTETLSIREQDIAHGFTPDLALPAFAHCWRCTVPLFQGRNVADSPYIECCMETAWQCTMCIDKPWGVSEDPSMTFHQWLLKVHAPVCGRRCMECHARINRNLAWKCIGCGLKENAACGASRCDACFAVHKLTCHQPVSRPADHLCPECDHSSIEFAAGVRRCLWCKAEWQAYYLGDKKHAWDKRSLAAGEER